VILLITLEDVHDRRRQPEPLVGGRGDGAGGRDSKVTAHSEAIACVHCLRPIACTPLLTDPAVADKARDRSHLLAIVHIEHNSTDLRIYGRTHGQ